MSNNHFLDFLMKGEQRNGRLANEFFLSNKDLHEKTLEEMTFQTLLLLDEDKEIPSINDNKNANARDSLSLKSLRKLKLQEIGATLEYATDAIATFRERTNLYNSGKDLLKEVSPNQASSQNRILTPLPTFKDENLDTSGNKREIKF